MRAFLTTVLTVFLSATAYGATFNVNSTVDASDLAPGDGVCLAPGGVCTLRAAVEETNALAGRDRINVPGGTYASASSIVITDRLDVFGSGVSTELTMPVFAGTQAKRIGVAVELNSLKLTTVYSNATLTLRHVTATNVTSGAEFDVYRDPHPGIRVYDSTVQHVRMTEALLVMRDAVMLNGSLKLADSAAFINRSSIVSSPIETLHRNTASRSDLVAVNSTFSGAATVVKLMHYQDTFDFNYSTFAGGASFSALSNGVRAATNSIFQTASGSPVCDPCGDNNLESPNPLLGPLTLENGRYVHPPLAGSPAIDSGNAPNRVDQRNFGRPSGGAPDRGSYEVCSTCPQPVRRTPGDFNLDGRGDIVWRHDPSKELAVWLMNGAAILSSHYIPESRNRTLRAIGDFDDDGDSDLMFDNVEKVLFMNGIRARSRTTFPSSTYYPLRPETSSVVAYGDFDGDGITDVVSHDRSTNAVNVQLMYGLFAMSRQVAAPSAEWTLVAARDFNGDGRADIVWRNSTTSEVLLWVMNEFFIESTVYLASPPPEWSLLAAGDFNGDGRADLLWRHSQSHDIAVWELDSNGNLVRAEVIARTPLPWHVRAVVRLNDDATEDLVWRHDGAGDNAAWLMAPGGGILSANYLVDVSSLEWSIVGPR